MGVRCTSSFNPAANSRLSAVVFRAQPMNMRGPAAVRGIREVLRSRCEVWLVNEDAAGWKAHEDAHEATKRKASNLLILDSLDFNLVCEITEFEENVI